VASYRVLLKKSAARELAAIESRDRARIIERINSLAENPRQLGAEKLSGQDKYRFRQGDYRILYEIHDREVVVIVVKIGNRREVYR
jgi:mRNA interferase RelE/StbE